MVGLGETAIDVSVGDDYNCVVLASGAIKCWGVNIYNNLGVGDQITRNDPTPVINLVQPALKVATGMYHTCALMQDGTVMCWGLNSAGQVKPETTGGNLSPVAVVLAKPAIEVSVGLTHSCAILNDHSVSCWGSNFDGQFGNGMSEVFPATAIATYLPKVRVVMEQAAATGVLYHECSALSVSLKNGLVDYTAPYDIKVALADENEIGSFYADSACANKITEADISSSSSSQSVYYRADSEPTGAAALSLSASVPLGGAASNNLRLTLAGPPVAASILTFSSSPSPDTCTAIPFGMVDSGGNVARSLIARSVQVNVMQGSVFLDENCTTPFADYELPQGSAPGMIYYKSPPFDVNASIEILIDGLNSSGPNLIIVGCGDSGCG